MLPERREDALVVGELDLVGRAVDVELGDVDRQAQRGQPRQRRLDRSVGRAGESRRERMALDADGVDQVLRLQQADDVHVAPHVGGVVGDAELVDPELRVREVLARQAERFEHPVPPGGAVAAERLDVVAVPGAARRIVQRLVHDVDLVDVRELLGDQPEPLFDLGPLLVDGQALDPGRLLVAPDQRVHAERDAVGLGAVVGRPEVTPVHRVAGALDAAPLAAVLRRDLVEVRREIEVLRRARDATEELGLAGRDRRARRRVRRRRRHGAAREAVVEVVDGVEDALETERPLVDEQPVLAAGDLEGLDEGARSDDEPGDAGLGIAVRRQLDPLVDARGGGAAADDPVGRRGEADVPQVVGGGPIAARRGVPRAEGAAVVEAVVVGGGVGGGADPQPDIQLPGAGGRERDAVAGGAVGGGGIVAADGGVDADVIDRAVGADRELGADRAGLRLDDGRNLLSEARAWRDERQRQGQDIPACVLHEAAPSGWKAATG